MVYEVPHDIPKKPLNFIWALDPVYSGMQEKSKPQLPPSAGVTRGFNYYMRELTAAEGSHKQGGPYEVGTVPKFTSSVGRPDRSHYLIGNQPWANKVSKDNTKLLNSNL